MSTFFKCLLQVGLLITTVSLVGQRSYLKIFDIDYGAELQDILCLNDGQIMTALSFINLETAGIQSGLLFQKISKKGDLIWSKVPPEFKNEEVEIETLIQTSKGEIVTVGLLGNDYFATDPFIAKLDTSANVIWKKTLNYPIPVYFTSVIENKKGELIVIGTYNLSNNNRAIAVFRFNSEGELLTSYEYADEEKERTAYDIVENSEAYYLAGNCPKGNIDASFSLLKLNDNFELQWIKNYHDSDENQLSSEASTLAVDRDGNLIVAGRESWFDKKMPGGKIIKADTAGNLLWEKNLGDNEHTAIVDLLVTSKNKYLALTEVRPKEYRKSICLFTLSSNGKILNEQLWERSANDRPKCIQAMKNEGYIWGGIGHVEIEEQVFLLGKLNKAGKLNWKKFKNKIPKIKF